MKPSCCTTRLPFELEREIFETASLISPRSIPSFLLVAQRFRVWLEPSLYRIIRSSEGRVVPPIYQPRILPTDAQVLDLPRLRRIGPWVRHILLQNRPSAEIAQVLAACPNASNVALWIVYGECSVVTALLAKMPLRRLSVDPSALFERPVGDNTVPLARALRVGNSTDADTDADANVIDAGSGRGAATLTHLEVINASRSWEKWHQLAQLPALTHLSMSGVLVDQELVNHLLAECRTLKVLVLFYITLFDLAALDMVQRDPRVVLLRSARDHLGNWETGARGGEDFWATAEMRVNQAQAIVKEEQRRWDVHDLVQVSGAYVIS